MRLNETKFDFDNTFKNKLDERFYSNVKPTPVSFPYQISFNNDLWENVLHQVPIHTNDDLAEYMSGNKLLLGSEPTAAIYSGHQFGYYTPQLGDGRAILLGQIKNKNGERFDLQLKGCGRTPYSRMGDGRAVLRSTVREYLGAEAMHFLGIPTTRSLSITGTDDPVYRETVETGAMLIRVGPSHVRIGNFELFHYRRQFDLVRKLADLVIDEHFSDLKSKDETERYLEFFRIVVQRTAKLMAQWQSVGFAHGVMNTDNFSILGLTIDYGPFGFLDNYDPGYICNHSDYDGRYAFDKQPSIAHWNMKKLSDALSSLPGMNGDKIDQILQEYDEIFKREYYSIMSAKLGLDGSNQKIVDELLKIMEFNAIDHTNLFRALGNLNHRNDNGTDVNSRLLSDDQFVARFFANSASCQVGRIQAWLKTYREALQLEGVDVTNVEQLTKLQEKMHKINPKYIMRNYILQTAIEMAQKKNFTEVERLSHILRRPYDEQPENEKYAADAPQWAKKIQISCSS
jgi:uncharacterized protein YdiU (UPF0061 family)